MNKNISRILMVIFLLVSTESSAFISKMLGSKILNIVCSFLSKSKTECGIFSNETGTFFKNIGAKLKKDINWTKSNKDEIKDNLIKIRDSIKKNSTNLKKEVQEIYEDKLKGNLRQFFTTLKENVGTLKNNVKSTSYTESIKECAQNISKKLKENSYKLELEEKNGKAIVPLK
jgi:hypothetical protein